MISSLLHKFLSKFSILWIILKVIRSSLSRIFQRKSSSFYSLTSHAKLSKAYTRLVGRHRTLSRQPVSFLRPGAHTYSRWGLMQPLYDILKLSLSITRRDLLIRSMTDVVVFFCCEFAALISPFYVVADQCTQISF